MNRTNTLLDKLKVSNAMDAQRLEIARELGADIDRYNELIKASKKRIEKAILASGTSLTGIKGCGPICAAMIIGQTGDIGRFASRNHYASYNATAPIEASSGSRVRHRLNSRGNRQLNWAVHVIAISQMRVEGQGRAYYLRKVDEGKTHKEALRALKRRISDVVYRHLVGDAKRAGN